MAPSRALIVDDEPDICELAEITLNRMRIDTESAHDINSAINLLKSQPFDLCITDMNLPDGNGIELVEHIQQHYPATPVAVITAYGNMQSAVRALKSGAFDFVSKPIDLQVFRDLVNSAIKLSSSSTETAREQANQVQLLGESELTRQLIEKINKLARSQAPVFIYGESGSGKELAARLIHNKGARAEQAFIAINCGAIPSELMESEFFGHTKGSFTGASADKDGLFVAADKGTLFLDEVADLPLPMQVKLLRAIQEKSIRPIGGHEERNVDVRILSASHKNLAELVEQGKFREDLFYRINVIELDIPPLRQRHSDIPILARHILQRITQKSAIEELPSLADDALELLQQYSFPGNVRELENILERSLALVESQIITAADIRLPVREKPRQQPPESMPEPMPDTPNPEPQVLDLESNQKALIEQALDKTHWNRTSAAKLLGLTPRQLSYRMNKLGIG